MWCSEPVNDHIWQSSGLPSNSFTPFPAIPLPQRNAGSAITGDSPFTCVMDQIKNHSWQPGSQWKGQLSLLKWLPEWVGGFLFEKSAKTRIKVVKKCKKLTHSGVSELLSDFFLFCNVFIKSYKKGRFEKNIKSQMLGNMSWYSFYRYIYTHTQTERTFFSLFFTVQDAAKLPIWKPFTRWTEIHTVLLTLLISNLRLSFLLR